MATWMSGRPSIVGILLVAALRVGAAEAAPPFDRTKVETFVDGAVDVAMRADHIAGVTVAIVDRAGVIMTKGYGFAAFSPAKKVNADTLFRVGSISKTVVWIAIMQLVEQGKISLDDPINQRLPDSLRVPDEGFRNPILIRHLMTHSAGFEDSLEGLFVHDPTQLRPIAFTWRRIVFTGCASRACSRSIQTMAQPSPALWLPMSLANLGRIMRKSTFCGLWV
jgi:CubicO group peptidase (beta-lactamase class C family)